MTRDSTNSPVLDYTTPAKVVSLPSAIPLYIALAAALIPMILGTITIAVWLFTFSEAFAVMGMVIFVGGIVLFGVGCVALLIYFVTCLRRSAHLGQSLWRTAIVTVLLVANFPLAFFYSSLAAYYHIHVVNNSGATLTNVAFVDPNGTKFSLGPIPNGSRASKWFQPQGEGAIHLTATANGIQSDTVVEGYVSGGVTGEQMTVTFAPTGATVAK